MSKKDPSVKGEESSNEVEQVVDFVPRTLTTFKYNSKYSAERG